MRRSLSLLLPLVTLLLVAGCGGTERAATTTTTPTTTSTPTVAAPAPRGPGLSRTKYLARVREIYCATAENIAGYQEEIATLEDDDPRSVDVMGEMSGYWGMAAREIGALATRPAYRAEAERFVESIQDVADFYRDAEQLLADLDDAAADEMRARYDALGPAGATAALALGFTGCEG